MRVSEPRAQASGFDEFCNRSGEQRRCGIIGRMERARGWLIAVAALMAAVLLAQSVGVVAGLGLIVLCVAGILGYRFYRNKRPARGPAVYCLRCGEQLAPTARQCKSCGSASWTMRQ